MKEQEKLSLEKVYEKMPDGELIEMLLVDEKEYEKGIYELISKEAKQRGIEEKVKEMEKQKFLSKADFAGLSKYYQEEFAKIYDSNESYRGKWNWGAFVFSIYWAVVKGLWGDIIIWFVAALFTLGIAAIIFPFELGARGTYKYYCRYAEKKNKIRPVYRK